MVLSRRRITIFILMLFVTASSAKSIDDFEWMTQIVSFLEPIPDGISPDCREHTMEYLVEMRNLTTWAVNMMDAAAKYPSGVLSGNIRSMGNFDQCLRVQHPRGKYEGKYCSLRLNYSTYGENEFALDRFIDLAMAGRRWLEVGDDWFEGTHILPMFSYSEWALCVPSSCTIEDVQFLGDVAIKRATNKSGLKISVFLDESNCYTASFQKPYTTVDIAVLLIFALLALVIVISTISCQLVSVETKKRFFPKFLNSFSLVDNWKKLMDVRSQPTNAITCLEGVRSLSTLWVVMTHQIVLIGQLPFINKLETVETHNHFIYHAFWNSYFNVDTFLLVSGLLRSHNLTKEFGKGRVSLIRSSLRRYLRLTPAYLAVVLFYMTIFDRLGTGPGWNYYVSRNVEACRQKWWHNLLYVNNYASGNNKCMLQSWYLAADMQLFLVSPLLVFFLWRWKSVDKAIVTIALVTSVALPFFTTLIYRLPGTYAFWVGNSLSNEYAHRVYMATHNRMSPYFVGLCLGTIVQRNNMNAVDMQKWKVGLGWTLSLAVMYVCVYGVKGITSVHHSYDLWEAAAYGGFHRITWATAVAWLIYACHTGHGGVINAFLSCKVFKVLGKLSYCMYLTHLAILLYNAAVLQTPRQLQTCITVRDFLGDFVLIFVFSLLLYICVESPIFNVTKRVFQ